VFVIIAAVAFAVGSSCVIHHSVYYKVCLRFLVSCMLRYRLYFMQPAREAWRAHGKKRWKIAGSEVSIGKLASCGYTCTQFINVQLVYLPWIETSKHLWIFHSCSKRKKERKKERRERKQDR
jgi:hypothetical protein